MLEARALRGGERETERERKLEEKVERECRKKKKRECVYWVFLLRVDENEECHHRRHYLHHPSEVEATSISRRYAL